MNGSAWGDRESLGEIANSNVIACDWLANSLDIFVVDVESAFWYKARNGTSWTGWESRERILESPIAFACNRVVIFHVSI